MQGQFHRLVKDFCSLAQLEDDEAIADGTSFCVNDIECALIYLEQDAPAIVHCYIDFGVPPVTRRVEVYRKLLEANYMEHAMSNSGFTVSPKTGHVVLVKAMHLSGATAETLADLLSCWALHAVEWRSHFFLDAHPPSKRSDCGDAGIAFA
jgi:hypothetical protein